TGGQPYARGAPLRRSVAGSPNGRRAPALGPPGHHAHRSRAPRAPRATGDPLRHREPGVRMGQHAVATLVSLALGVGAVVAFPYLRPAARAAVAFVFGSLAVVHSALPAQHIP